MFFKVKTPEEVKALIEGFDALEQETVPLEHSLGRVLAREIHADQDLPGFYRSTMDGYAVRAEDTYGATESLPAFVEVMGEVVMGERPAGAVRSGRAFKISTGGMLPEGADGVVMVEHTHVVDGKMIEVSRAISPLENVIQPDDDVKRGARVLAEGRALRPQDLGVMAGLGIPQVPVFRRPRVAILSTGDEVVPVDQEPRPGQVRDINSYSLSAFCRQCGAEPALMGLCRDRFEELKEKIEEGLSSADTVWVSGGSSVGTRDLTLQVIESFEDAQVLVHGISIRPGKPTIIARIGHRVVFGLPGQTASAMVVAEVFLGPFLARLSGRREKGETGPCIVKAALSRNVESVSGRDDYIRVSLRAGDGKLWADPIFGKSGLISTLVAADGLITVDRNTEGLYRDQEVYVRLFR